MARPLRVEYPGALYHVITRGNAQQNIFLDDQDRLAFLGWLKDTVEVHNLICHAYCLMENHFHLLLETPDSNLSKAMHDLNGNYTQWFNAKNHRVGHLFQGRYKSYIIEKETYLLEVARYIVLNPVRAGLVDDPGAWPWSSYRATAGEKEAAPWLNISWILGMLSSEKESAQKEFRHFIIVGINGKDPHEELRHGFLLGSDQFVHQIWEQTSGSEVLKELPREQRIVGRPTLDELFQDVKGREERDEVIIFARSRCGYLSSEIARHIGLDPSVVGKISRRKYNRK